LTSARILGGVEAFAAKDVQTMTGVVPVDVVVVSTGVVAPAQIQQEGQQSMQQYRRMPRQRPLRPPTDKTTRLEQADE
jgi:hypothetical protein